MFKAVSGLGSDSKLHEINFCPGPAGCLINTVTVDNQGQNPSGPRLGVWTGRSKFASARLSYRWGSSVMVRFFLVLIAGSVWRGRRGDQYSKRRSQGGGRGSSQPRLSKGGGGEEVLRRFSIVGAYPSFSHFGGCHLINILSLYPLPVAGSWWNPGNFFLQGKATKKIVTKTWKCSFRRAANVRLSQINLNSQMMPPKKLRFVCNFTGPTLLIGFSPPA